MLTAVKFYFGFTTYTFYNFLLDLRELSKIQITTKSTLAGEKLPTGLES